MMISLLLLGSIRGTMWAEFLEDNRDVPLPPPPARGLELMISTSIVERLAQRQILEKAKRNTERTARIRRLYKQDLPPLVLVCDNTGVVLQDGHHRLSVALQDGVEWLRVELRTSERVRVQKVPVHEFLTFILSPGGLRLT